MNLITTYIYKNQDIPTAWYKTDPETEKEYQVQEPDVPDSLRGDIIRFEMRIKETDFWQKNSFASLIRVTCDLDDCSVVSVEARKNHLAFTNINHRTDIQWYLYRNNVKLEGFYKGKKPGDQTNLEPISFEDYKEYHKIIKSFVELLGTGGKFEVNFGEVLGEFSLILIKNW